MAFQFSESVRNAQADSVSTIVGTAPTLEIRTTSVPADCDAADTGDVLVSMTLPSAWMQAASWGVAVKSTDAWTAAATGTGIAAHFRLKNSGTCFLQGSVAMSAGADLVLQNTNIVTSQQVTITTFTLTTAGD
jgi:hypothetical protein